MITAYHRPRSIAEALSLLNRKGTVTVPLGGGTLLSHGSQEAIEVVDLQSLGLNVVKRSGNTLEIGATATLQSLLQSQDTPTPFETLLKLEAPLNLRNSATVAGTIVACDGRSTFATALLALDARLTLMKPQLETMGMGDFLPLRMKILPGALITGVQIPTNTRFAFEYVSRTPADKPIVCVALVQWPSGRTRLTLGGFGAAPILAMDGTEPVGLEVAARNAFHDASDPWGSAEYRMDVGARLARRCLESLDSQS